MNGNIFTKPTQVFKEALEAPNLGIAILIVLIVSLIFGAIFFIGTGNIILGATVTITSIVQWLVLSIIYYIFEFMFTAKQKHKIKTNFLGIISATSKLWLMMLVLEVLLGIALLGGIILTIAGILSIIVLVLILINSFILMKIILDTTNTRSFIAWFLAILIYMLLLTIASILTQLLI
ncbi:MAG: hypothetical protein WC915_05200 [archaeon]|jgi:hypothetical protein